ncbi:hypothetical protein [Pseudaestuariivita atlantica]|uniref:Clp protease n=1 Tax=Pseudaestuariivita atlantica TaxID=1317121 RepID=A0A0L1JQV4_9RHOB|nr:hypothetical protein [Pseudaestuariivita atlantica]KNG94169.1 hypothetical protein ATO11_08045 [Pseudaestuariivita atlantica]
MRRWSGLILAAAMGLAAGVASAEDDAETTERAAKFTVDGPVLVYDTATLDDYPDAEVDHGDHKELRRLLRANPDITTLRLNSHGGRVYAGFRMADIVIDFGLKTVVDGVCSSSCVYVFLGGTSRQMTGGSRIGFHHRTWDAGDLQAYYDRWRKDEGWTTLFDFAAWLFVDTQQESYEELQFYLERGVTADFAIKTMKVREEDMWYPRRSELRAAGILRD